ncbi:MAG TPA: polyamine aminopropyltransferase [Burkholderiaceae bacterium]|nr:polyamine aminopropyltransferase [Burkholderiaceae bacterium]
MQGLHLTADLYNCGCDQSLMTQADKLADLCRHHTIESGLTVVDEKWHTFPDYQGQPGGVTGALLLAESHLAIHTWPERQAITLDVYVCNFEGDNSAKAEQLLAAIEAEFAPGQVQHNRLWRGDSNGPSGDLYWETLNQDSVYGFRFQKRLLDQQTRYQHLELLESADLGKTLRLDGCLMTAENEEFFYHECLIHPATISHAAPKTALIVGGGDGGALEELLKHPLESVTLVDLDEQVIEVSRKHLQNINKGAFDDARVTVKVGDGAEFVATTEQRFDLVFLDLTDPETPAGPLYTPEFFKKCQKVLAPGGAIVLHLGAPFYEPKQVSQLAASLNGVFTHVSAYGLHIPLYGAYWALAVASDSLQPKAIAADTVTQRLADRGVTELQYYNPEVHGALFALPTYYRNLLP